MLAMHKSTRPGLRGVRGWRLGRKIQLYAIGCPDWYTYAQKICVFGPDRAADRHRTRKHRPILGIPSADSQQRLLSKTSIGVNAQNFDAPFEMIQQ